MHKTVSFLTIGLMVFSVTLATYTLTKEILSGPNAAYQTVLIVEVNQGMLKHVALTSIQPGTEILLPIHSTPNFPRNCNAHSIQKIFSNNIHAIKSFRSL